MLGPQHVEEADEVRSGAPWPGRPGRSPFLRIVEDGRADEPGQQPDGVAGRGPAPGEEVPHRVAERPRLARQQGVDRVEAGHVGGGRVPGCEPAEPGAKIRHVKRRGRSDQRQPEVGS